MALATKSTTFAKDGQYFVGTSPTPGTGIASLTAPTTFDDTKPFILLNNGDATKTLTLDYIRLQCTAPGTGGTALNWGVKTDVLNALRYTSGGSDSAAATMLIKNVNMGSSVASSARLLAGAIVAIASGTGSRLLGHGLLRTVIPVIGDTYLFTFGGDVGAGVSSSIVAGTAVATTCNVMGPCILAPGQWMAFHLWLPGPQSAASSYEIEIGWVEA